MNHDERRRVCAENDELAALARVLKPALYLLLQFWQLNGDRFPPSHPYRQAALMVIRYLESRYGV